MKWFTCFDVVCSGCSASSKIVKNIIVIFERDLLHCKWFIKLCIYVKPIFTIRVRKFELALKRRYLIMLIFSHETSNESLA